MVAIDPLPTPALVSPLGRGENLRPLAFHRHGIGAWLHPFEHDMVEALNSLTLAERSSRRQSSVRSANNRPIKFV